MAPGPNDQQAPSWRHPVSRLTLGVVVFFVILMVLMSIALLLLGDPSARDWAVAVILAGGLAWLYRNAEAKRRSNVT